MSRWIVQGKTESIVAIREDARFRTNLILANATESNLEVDLALFASAGQPLASRRVSLRPLEMTQLARFVRELGVISAVTNVQLFLSTPTVGGAFAAYASVIDNVTNDPRTLLPQ